MTTIYLIRHGEAEGNIYRRLQGNYDSDLTALGRRQVEALGKRFWDIPLDAVYSSDLYRAMETGAVLCRRRNLPLHTDRRLREVHVGPWEDQPMGNAWADDPENMTAFVSMSPAFRLSGAETFSALAARGVAALEDIVGKNPNRTVAVCAHGAVLRSILGELFPEDHIPWGTNTSVSLLTWKEGRWSLQYANTREHLTGDLLNLPGDRDMCIRPMEENAVEEYIRYRKDAWQVVYGDLRGFDGPGFWLDAQRSIGKDPMGMVVGYIDGRPAGMIQLNPSRDANRGVGYIPFLYLREEYRHQGLGIQLIGHAVSFYRRLGRSRLQLSVYPGNKNALGFYDKYGFVQVKKQRGRFGHLLLMEKDITPPSVPEGVEIISL